MARPRKLDVPLASGSFEVPAGSKITMRMSYRSVENGAYGDIVPMPASAPDGERTKEATVFRFSIVKKWLIRAP